MQPPMAIRLLGVPMAVWDHVASWGHMATWSNTITWSDHCQEYMLSGQWVTHGHMSTQS